MCLLLNEILAQKHNISSDTADAAEVRSSESESNVYGVRQARVIHATLRVMRAHFELSIQARKGNSSQGMQVHAAVLAPKLEPALRELLVDEGCCSLLPTHVRTAAMEAYNAGMQIFFEGYDSTLEVLRPILGRAVMGGASGFEKDLCCRCLCVCNTVIACMNVFELHVCNQTFSI
jgi:hypothetical protein